MRWNGLLQSIVHSSDTVLSGKYRDCTCTSTCTSTCTCTCISIYMYMLMRDAEGRKEGRKKQARSYKQQSKAAKHTNACVYITCVLCRCLCRIHFHHSLISLSPFLFSLQSERERSSDLEKKLETVKTKLSDQEMACTVRRHFAPGSVHPGINEEGGGGVWDAQSVNWGLVHSAMYVASFPDSQPLVLF